MPQWINQTDHTVNVTGTTDKDADSLTAIVIINLPSLVQYSMLIKVLKSMYYLSTYSPHMQSL